MGFQVELAMGVWGAGRSSDTGDSFVIAWGQDGISLQGSGRSEWQLGGCHRPGEWLPVPGVLGRSTLRKRAGMGTHSITAGEAERVRATRGQYA